MRAMPRTMRAGGGRRKDSFAPLTILLMDYLGRQKKFQQTLAAERLDGFVVTHPANLRYLCGYSGSNGLLLLLAGRKTFFTDGRYTLQAREEVKGTRVVISKGALIKDAAAAIAKLRSAAIGFEADTTTVAAAEQMRELTPKRIRWKPTAGLVMRQRIIKDAEELKLIRAAVQLGAKVYTEALRSLKPGVAETEVAGETRIRCTSRRRRCDVVRDYRCGGKARRTAAWARIECCYTEARIRRPRFGCYTARLLFRHDPHGARGACRPH